MIVPREYERGVTSNNPYRRNIKRAIEAGATLGAIGSYFYNKHKFPGSTSDNSSNKRYKAASNKSDGGASKFGANRPVGGFRQRVRYGGMSKRERHCFRRLRKYRRSRNAVKHCLYTLYAKLKKQGRLPDKIVYRSTGCTSIESTTQDGKWVGYTVTANRWTEFAIAAANSKFYNTATGLYDTVDLFQSAAYNRRIYGKGSARATIKNNYNIPVVLELTWLKNKTDTSDTVDTDYTNSISGIIGTYPSHTRLGNVYEPLEMKKSYRCIRRQKVILNPGQTVVRMVKGRSCSLDPRYYLDLASPTYSSKWGTTHMHIAMRTSLGHIQGSAVPGARAGFCSGGIDIAIDRFVTIWYDGGAERITCYYIQEPTSREAQNMVVSDMPVAGHNIINR